MNKLLTSEQTLRYFDTACKMERFKHIGYKIRLDPNTEASFCSIYEHGNIDIDIGTNNVYRHQSVTDDDFVQLYARLYHELGHGDTYAKIKRKQLGIDKAPFTDIEKHILLDRAIGSILPEYTVAIYLDNYDEKLAEINSLSNIRRMASDKHSIFNKLGINAEQTWLDHIKNNAWYSQDMTAIANAGSLQDCIDLLQSELDSGNLSVPLRLQDASQFVSDIIRNPQPSIFPELQQKPELIKYIDKAKDKNEFEQRILDSIHTVRPDLIDDSLKQLLPIDIKYPCKLIIKSDREIKHKPDFMDNLDTPEHDYVPP